jgi:hypothetical protein
MHYARWSKYGDPLYAVRSYGRQPETCEADCDEPTHALGLCKMHYKRSRVHGETTDPYVRKFWAQVDQRGPDDCWPWTGYVASNGYGQFGGKGKDKGTNLPHRIAYQFMVGPIPDGLVLDHLCHTTDPQCADTNDCPHRRCVNPRHLEPVTYRENIARGRGGDSWGYVPDPIPAKPVQLALDVCANGCAKPVYKSGLCRPCYRKWLKDPAVERPSQRTPEQRFWMKVQKTPTCWLWTAGVNRLTGYGRFGLRHGVMVDAHRYSYELAHGTIAAGLDVHHTCLTRRCVNPDHLEAVTRSENLRLRKNRRTA